MYDLRKTARFVEQHPQVPDDVGAIAAQITEDPDVINEFWPFKRKEKEYSQEERRSLLQRASEALGQKFPDVGGQVGTIQRMINKEESIITDPESTEVQKERARKRLNHWKMMARRLNIKIE